MTIVSNVQLPAAHPFSGRDVTSLLADRVAAFGDHTWLQWEPPPGQGEASSWTYAEFGAAVERAAAGLVDRGVCRGDAVMLFLENSPAFLISWFACARIGAVAVDTNVNYVADEVAHAASLTEPVGVITHTHLVDRLGDLPATAWVVEVDLETGTCPALDGDPATLPPAAEPDPAAAMCIQFTSGTTARPKAALYTHANVLWAAMVGASRSRARGDDVVFVHAPLFHTMAIFWQTLPSLWVGASVVLVPKFSVSRFWEVSLRHGCTHTFLQPVMATLAAEPIPEHSYISWITGLEIPVLEKMFGIRIQSSWGMTEVVTSVLVNDPAAPSAEGSIGRVGPEYSIRVVSEETGKDAAEGELRVSGVRGLSLFAGYHRNPEATADGFDEQGMWRTGDLVRLLPSGDVQFVSRIKDMLRVGGENVAAAEIERVLVEHPAVSAAGVVGHPEQYRGEVAVGFVVAAGVAADAESLAAFEAELIAHCTERLAGFKVPRRVHVIEELPESLIGKTSKKILAEQAVALGLGDA